MFRKFESDPYDPQRRGFYVFKPRAIHPLYVRKLEWARAVITTYLRNVRNGTREPYPEMPPERHNLPGQQASRRRGGAASKGRKYVRRKASWPPRAPAARRGPPTGRRTFPWREA